MQHRGNFIYYCYQSKILPSVISKECFLKDEGNYFANDSQEKSYRLPITSNSVPRWEDHLASLIHIYARFDQALHNFVKFQLSIFSGLW